MTTKAQWASTDIAQYNDQWKSPPHQHIHTAAASPFFPLSDEAYAPTVSSGSPEVSARTFQWLCTMNGISTAPFISLSIVMLSHPPVRLDTEVVLMYTIKTRICNIYLLCFFSHRGKGWMWNYKVKALVICFWPLSFTVETSTFFIDFSFRMYISTIKDKVRQNYISSYNKQ